MRTLPPIELPRTVEEGSVFCPVEMGHVSVDRCPRCGFMNEPTRNSSGDLTEFVCCPSRVALISSFTI